MAERCKRCHSIAHEESTCLLQLSEGKGNVLTFEKFKEAIRMLARTADPVIPYPPEKSEERLKAFRDDLAHRPDLIKRLLDAKPAYVVTPGNGEIRFTFPIEVDECSPEHLERLAQTMTPKQRQAFYEHLYHKHGCRIF